MPYLTYLKFAAGAILAASLVYLGWSLAANHYERIQADEHAAAAKQYAALVAKSDQLKHDAENQHGQDQTAVNDLHNQLGRMREHIPTCNTVPTTSGPSTNGTARPLPDRVDEAFGRLQERAVELMGRCDQLNIDTRAMNAALGYAP